jgi:hypothetical protein
MTVQTDPVDRRHNQGRAPPLLPGSNTQAGPLPHIRIHRPGRSVTSSAPARTGWVLEFERSSAPYIEPLMGWTGGDDPFAQIRLNFPDLQSAIAFAERHGWPYRVEDTAPQRSPLISYADRFRYDLANAIRRAMPSVEPVAGEPTRRQINRIAGVGTDGGEDRRTSWPMHTDKDRRAPLQHH